MKKSIDDFWSFESGSINSENDKSLTSLENKVRLNDDSLHKEFEDAFGVRIKPACVLFTKLFEGQTYRQSVKIQNISSKNITLRTFSVNSPYFQVNATEKCIVAPGLTIKRVIIFRCTKAGICSSLPLQIDDNLYEIPIVAYKERPILDVDPTRINFGNVDLGSKSEERTFTLHNKSVCAAKFWTDVGPNLLNVTVIPSEGRIHPSQKVTIQIYITPLVTGECFMEVGIITKICSSRVQVFVEVNKRELKVFHPNSMGRFTLIDFKSTFCGCYRYETIVVYNKAATDTLFLVLAVVDRDMMIPIKEAQKKYINFQIFDVEPKEGRISPYEGRIITIKFNPVMRKPNELGWNSKHSEYRDSFLSSIKILRICAEDYIPKNKTLLTHFPNEIQAESDISVVLCLHGDTEKASLLVYPESLSFDNIPLNSRELQKMYLTNPSTSLMLAFKYVKISGINLKPEFAFIKPTATIEVIVTTVACSSGNKLKKICLDLLSYSNMTDKVDIKAIGQVKVLVRITVCPAPAILPKPKFNPGITPMITHEVGFLTDSVTFLSAVQKPRNAVLQVSKRKSPWLHSNNVIAFPNDMPKSLRQRDPRFARTIFTGMPRYNAPIDTSMTHPLGYLETKNQKEYKWFKQIFKGTAAQILEQQSQECDITCLKHYQMLSLKPKTNIKTSKKKFLEIPKEMLLPLTILQLYNIKIKPEIISFGNVTSNKDCYQSLSIENRNAFPISVRLQPECWEIRLNKVQNVTIIQPQCTEVMELIFHKQNIAHFKGSCSCIINENHCFEIVVEADVVSKSLRMTPENIVFKMANVPFCLKFIPVEVQSFLNTPGSFSWVVPSDAPYIIEPMNGIVRPKGIFACAIYFEPTKMSFKTSQIRLKVKDIKNQILRCNATMKKKPNVYFLNQELKIGVLPFGLLTVKNVVIFNAEYDDVMFVLLNSKPVEGISIFPDEGFIKARSCFTLFMNFTMHQVGNVSFIMYVTILNSITIELKVSATIVAPQLEIKPRKISLLHIPCNSWFKTLLTLTNKSKAPMEVSFAGIEKYSQFRISLSRKVYEHDIGNKSLSIDPETSIKLYLHFVPKNLASYEFCLPLILNNGYDDAEGEIQATSSFIIKDSKMSFGKAQKNAVKSKERRVLIECLVVPPVISFSNLIFKFNELNQKKLFTFKNHGSDVATIFIDLEEIHTKFVIDYSCCQFATAQLTDKSIKVLLDPSQEVKYDIEFVSLKPGVSTAELPVYINDTIHHKIHLIGELPPLYTLSCSKQQIFMMPVPLNTESKFSFDLLVLNNLDSNIEITYEFDKIYYEVLNLTFLRKPQVASGSTSVPVSVTFCSNTPTSIKAKITFQIKGSTKRCTTTLCATADSSILTTYAFLFTHSNPDRLLKDYDESLDSDDEVEIKDGSSYWKGEKSLSRSVVALYKDSPSGDHSTIRTSKSDITNNTYITMSGDSQEKALVKELNKYEDNLMFLKDSLEFDEILSYRSGYRDVHVSLGSTSDTTDSKNTIEDTEVEGAKDVYPKFPFDSGSHYSKYMIQIRNSVELWLYEQVFCCYFHPSIGSETFSEFFVIDKKYASKHSTIIKNILDVMERLFGKEILKYLPSLEKLPAEGTNRVVYIHLIYFKIIDFITAQGGLLSHLEPHLLMSYADYMMFVKHKKASTSTLAGTADLEENTLSKSDFYQLSMQSWLDLLLQTYKVTTLTSCLKKTSNPHKPEDILLSWLGRHYNSQRLVLWKDRTQAPNIRTIKNFNQDLEDGLVLITVTLAYCPFLVSFFEDVFLQPENISQAYHNAVRLITAWNKIHLGFSISPKDFSKPNPVAMLMLVTHLYTILPSYEPEASIDFSAALNTTITREVTFENPNDYFGSISYVCEIVGDEYNCFSLNEKESIIKISKGQKISLNVCYTGRKTTKVTATLLVCGACLPARFGRNFAFTLKGYPVQLSESAVFNVNSPLNIPIQTTLWITTPHQEKNKNSCEEIYEVWWTDNIPSSDHLDFVKWSAEDTIKIPRRLILLSYQLKIVQGEKVARGPLDIQVTCFSMIIQHHWLIFINKNVGDFIVKVTTSAYSPPPMSCLRGTAKLCSSCTCLENQISTECKLSCTLQIPSRNQDIWTSIKIMFYLLTPPEEHEFWSLQLDKKIGLDIVNWIFEYLKVDFHKNIQHIFDKSKTYIVSCPNELVSFHNEAFTIIDTRDKGTNPFTIHVTKDCQFPLRTTIKLTSLDNNEIRVYDLLIEK